MPNHPNMHSSGKHFNQLLLAVWKRAKQEAAWSASHGKAHRDLIPPTVSFITLYTGTPPPPTEYANLGNQRSGNRFRQITKVKWLKKMSPREFWLLYERRFPKDREESKSGTDETEKWTEAWRQPYTVSVLRVQPSQMRYIWGFRSPGSHVSTGSRITTARQNLNIKEGSKL